MSPAEAREIVRRVAESRSEPRTGVLVLFGCECGWKSPYGPRRAGLLALRRHLIKCH